MSGSFEGNAAQPDRAAEVRRGLIAGVGSYLFWGMCPLFWALLSHVSPWEIIGHRIVWSLVIVAIVCWFALKQDFVALLKDKRARRYLAPAGLLIMLNWSLYIIAVVTGHVVETALGYYINPLLSILIGLVVFHERLTVLQTAASVISAAGVLYFTVDFGSFPWIAVVLAITFATYGAVKKKGGYAPVPALAVEGVVALPFALVVLAWLAFAGQSTFLMNMADPQSWLTSGLLLLAGPVTAVPLVLFATAANKAPLSLVGFIQYLSPTVSLLIGVFVLGEPFTPAHVVCFACIWGGCAMVIIDALLHLNMRKRRPRSQAAADCGAGGEGEGAATGTVTGSGAVGDDGGAATGNGEGEGDDEDRGEGGGTGALS